MVLGSAADAQDPRTPPPTRVPIPETTDTIPAARDSAALALDSLAAGDSLVLRDSLSSQVSAVPADSVKSPIAVAPRGRGVEISGRRVVWNREAIFESGALTLPDLLAELPGATSLNSSFISGLAVTSWYGQPGRVRVYLDGVELDAIDPRDRGVRDLSSIQLWPLEEVAVERTAGELRVHLRTWRVQLTTAETRTDIATGSENLNLYRGFFGKRFNNGGVVQLAGQQYSNSNPRVGGDGDALAAFGRFGVARGRLTLDAVATRFSWNRSETLRNPIVGTPNVDPLVGFDGRDIAAYLRAGWGSPDEGGLWAQFVAATIQHIQDSDRPLRAPGDTTPDVDPDTSSSQSQYVASVGFTRWGADFSATGRYRVSNGEQRFSPALRGFWGNNLLQISGYSEASGPDSTTRSDLSLRVTPLNWLHVGGSYSVHTPDDVTFGGPERRTSRADVALRVRGRWISFGAVDQSTGLVPGLYAFDTAYTTIGVGRISGIEGSVSGQIVGPLSFAWRGIKWEREELYRSRVESHAELRVSTGFERHIRRGNFRLTAALTHEYRSSFSAPLPGGGAVTSWGAGVMGSHLEIRLGSANIFWINRNFNGKIYETVPGFMMPRMVQVYGVRWSFWN